MLTESLQKLRAVRPRATIALGHASLAAAAYLLAFLIRFDFTLPEAEWQRFLYTLPLLVGLRLAVFAHYRLYSSLWRYMSVHDLMTIFRSVAVGSLFFLASALLFFGHGFPRGVFLLDLLLCFAIISGARVGTWAFLEHKGRAPRDPGAGISRALIVGAGNAGELLAREVGRDPQLSYELVGFVDDDPRKISRLIHGFEVLGSIDQLPDICRANDVEEVLIAMPSASKGQIRRVVEACKLGSVSFKTVPGINALLRGNATISQLNKVDPEVLIGRDVVRLDRELLERELRGKRIMVTGAGGSIGSALCRELAALQPELLVLFERAESSLYFAELKLRLQYPGLGVVPVLGDILDRQKLDQTIEQHRPQIIYHAAAYKHVPLMEAHPLDAVKNNIIGTKTVARAGMEGGVEKFVFISTDKAVDPVGIMGMTKRVGECLLQSLGGGPTTFVAVRFGNVLGSDGSVFPLFEWQIEKGGPVTVTDPDASRFFMLPSEAAQLVLQAGAMGRGGEIYFLDMGDPIRIMDLAENMIRLHGLEPGEDVTIETVGLRPGERLHETLFTRGEGLLASGHEKIFQVRNGRFDIRAFERDLERLKELVATDDVEAVTTHLEAMTDGKLMKEPAGRA